MVSSSGARTRETPTKVLTQRVTEGLRKQSKAPRDMPRKASAVTQDEREPQSLPTDPQPR